MAQQQISFLSDHLKLEGLLHLSPGNKGVVITHPHPLYGGDMDNVVVATLARVYQQKGYTTLRFNFRGVSGSQGKYDQGQGEQEDMRAALHYLSEQGMERIDLAGYSFGAWVNALAQPPQDIVQRMILVSPPVVFLDFRPVSFTPSLKLVIVGNRDQFAPPEAIKSMLSRWNPTALLEVIEDADHFYGGCMDRLASVLAAYLES